MLPSALISICSFSQREKKKKFYFWRFRRLAIISFFKTSVKGARSPLLDEMVAGGVGGGGWRLESYFEHALYVFPFEYWLFNKAA